MAKRLTIAIFLLLSAACERSKHPPEVQWNAFDGARAYAHVQRLVSYGPRPSGSPGLGRAATYIATQLQEYGLKTEEQVFVAPTPRGPTQFRNVIGKTPTQQGGEGRIVLFASHYDTKLMPDIHHVGANDAGSSTGVLLEMARVAANQPNLWFVFFDGEECMVEYGERDGLWGSKFFVEELKAKNQLNWIKAMVLLDMVGDANLNITVPPNGTGWLVQKLFDAARAAGYRDYFGVHRWEILDDHVPFLLAGVPAVNIIDFEFGSAPGLNDYWHTEQDTLDKISPRSMEIVGQTALRLLSLLQKEPPAR